MKSLKKKSIKGAIWALVDRFGVSLSKFTFGIVLARLLTPEDFGIIGMITVFIAIAQVIVDGGFGLAFVQKKEVQKIDADTVFISNIVLSVVVFFLVFLCAPIIANFYEKQELVNIIRVLSTLILLNSINVIQRAKLVRDIDFKKIAKINLISISVSGIVAISAAYFGAGVWALVVQSICNRIIVGFGYWTTSKYRPTCHFSIQSFKEMFSFGSWMFLSNIIRSIFDNIYHVAIGKLFPVAQLGYYTKAKQLVQLSINNFSTAIGTVSFPVYSKLQEDKDSLPLAMKSFIKHTMFLIVPIISILFVIAKPLILVLLTDKWAAMVLYFQLLCFTAIFYPLNQINIQSLIAIGKSKLSFRLELFRNVFRLLNILITYKYGVSYIIIGETVIAFLFFLINATFNQIYIKYSLFNQIKDIWKPILGGLITTTFSFLVISFIDNLVTWLFLGIINTGLVYLLFQYLINRDILYSSLKILTSLKNK